jgi:glutamate-1-semialdehyde 2,1-aminomutase
MSSSRLPNKVLMPIMGTPMLELQINRLKRCKNIDRLVIATSIEPSDRSITELCDKIGVSCYQGSLDDVLDRFYQVAKENPCQHIVRLTGDCPLTDPKIIDEVISYYLEGDFDFACNYLEPTLPDGLDVSVFRSSALKDAWDNALLPSEREHVTPYIINRPNRYKIGSYKHKSDLSNLRWTVDEPKDFQLVQKIYESLLPQKPEFTMSDVLNLIQQEPELATLNTEHKRDEGLQKSLKVDQEFVQQSNQSIQLQYQARQRIPGMTQLLSKRPDQFSFGVWPGYYKKAKGIEVTDLDDKTYFDMSIGGIGANVLGYADDDVDNLVVEAIRNGVSCSLNCAEEVELADLLCQLHPWADKVRFARSGGEAMTIAVRIARAKTGRDKLAFCGYHGWHDWYLAANLGSENALGGHLLPGLSPKGVPRALANTAIPFRYNRIEELRKIIAENKDSLAAIVMEPIRNDEPAPGFLEEIRSLATAHNLVLIFDEISSGFRMNSGGAHLLYGVEPDIAVFSKALGNGYPMSAIIGRGNIMEAAQETFISSTNWTERVGPVAALATIRKHQRLNVGAHLVEIGSAVQKGWSALADKHQMTIHVGGIKPLSHFTFEEGNPLELKALFVQLMLEQGFLASTIFYAMYAHKIHHVHAYLNAVDKAFAEIAAYHKLGKVTTALKGKPSIAGFKRLN